MRKTLVAIKFNKGKKMPKQTRTKLNEAALMLLFHNLICDRQYKAIAAEIKNRKFKRITEPKRPKKQSPVLDEIVKSESGRGWSAVSVN